MNSVWKRFLAIAVMTTASSAGCATMDPAPASQHDPSPEASVSHGETERATSLDPAGAENLEPSCPAGTVDCCSDGACITPELCFFTKCAT